LRRYGRLFHVVFRQAEQRVVVVNDKLVVSHVAPVAWRAALLPDDIDHAGLVVKADRRATASLTTISAGE